MGVKVRKAMGLQSSSPGEGRAAARDALAIAGVGVGLGYAAPLVAGYYGRTAAVRLRLVIVVNRCLLSRLIMRKAELFALLQEVD